MIFHTLDEIIDEMKTKMPEILDEPITSQRNANNEFFVDGQKIKSLDENIEKVFANDAINTEWMNGVFKNLDAPLDRYTISLRESLLLKDFSQMPQ